MCTRASDRCRGSPALLRLLDFLAQQSLLLVPDDAEHLVGGLGLVEAILAAAPRVKLLVTSRQSLALRWEWHFALKGMAVPAHASIGQPEAYSGVRLFVERTRRVEHSFSLADDPAGVIRICQMVEGMPLDIELAASSLRVMSRQDIAAPLVDLQTPYQYVEARHVSLRALFENTWQRLSGSEQQQLE
jgi:predicted ATPase